MKKPAALNNTPARLYILFAIVFAAMGTYFLTSSHAAGVGVMSLSPATGTLGIGTNVTVTVTENSSTVPVNAVQANLTYDQTKLQFVSISTSTSPFNLVAQSTGGTGTVAIGSAATTAVTGSQTVGIVTFTVIGTGSTTVNVAAGSGLAEADNSSDILGTLTGATYTLADTTAPSVPAGLASSTQTATTIALSWTASTDNVGVTGYKIFRGGTQIGTSTTPAYNDSNLAPSNSYSYTVAAYDAAGNTSAQSTAKSVSTTADTTAPSVPTNLVVGTKTINSISFTWGASTDNVGVTGYKISRNGTQVGTSTSASYTNTGLAAGTTYSFTVAANDAAGNTSAQSSVGSFATLADTAAPSVPTGLTSTGQTATSVSLKWNASTDNVAVTGYKIFRGGTQIGTSATNTYTDSGLVVNTTYSYTVAAYDATGNTSAQTSAAAFKTTSVPGDANNDGHVTFLDLSILASTWQSTTDLRADFNHDGVVNFLDLSILASNWGT